MKCKVCKQSTKEIFTGRVLGKYTIRYFYCDYCGFLQTEEPYWLEEAYSEPINISDTGYLQRNIYLSKIVTILLSLFFNKDAKFLDYGGGYGVFVRLMRDIGFDFYWYDKYTPNIFAKGFEHKDSNKYEAITAFECFEHFVNPIDEIEFLLKMSRNIILTTELLPNPVPNPQDWWYYGLNHGQHISFYSKKTFYFIARKYNLHYANLRNLHLLTEKKISNFKLKVLKLAKVGFHKVLQLRLKSRTWDDMVLLCNKVRCA